MGNLVEVRNLVVRFRTDEGLVHAINDISFDIPQGKTLGLVGESGCGKSVTANAIMHLLPKNGWIESGSIGYVQGKERFEITEIGPKDKRMQVLHGGEMAMIFQEPMTSFCPVYTVGNQIIESVRLHTDIPKSEERAYVIDLLRKVQIANPEQRIDEYPYQLSGGMRQRAMIAMALVSKPRLLVADEPTTSLDVTVQAQILHLMLELQEEYSMSMLMINHNFGIIAETSDVVGVMYLGRIVELARISELLDEPAHPYTRDLFDSIPRITDERGKRLSYIKGTVPDTYCLPHGCAYYPRCAKAVEGLCDVEVPGDIPLGDGLLLSSRKSPTHDN